jgi:hypothetical protein
MLCASGLKVDRVLVLLESDRYGKTKEGIL